MAIDGIKIIDSDLANDVYNEFMNLYDANVDMADIIKKIETWRDNLEDEVEFEIFITSYGLALWEVGYLSENLLNEIKATTAKDVGPKFFQNELGEKGYGERKKELSKFINKISKPKAFPKKRKKYKKVTNLLLDIDSVVTFKTTYGTYRAAILLNIDHYKNRCVYQFTPTSYMGDKKPILGEIISGKVFIHKIGCMYDRKIVKTMQPGIEKFWGNDSKFSIPFTIGLPIYGVEHKDLIKFIDNLEIIGNAKVRDSYKQIGSIGYEDSFENFRKKFIDVINCNVNIFKYEIINLKEILE